MTRVLPCITPRGPANAKIFVCGEAPGEQEEFSGIPFIGHSGQELNRMLEEAGIERKDCWLTNVLLTRPPQNKLDAFCLSKKELPSGYNLPSITQGRYLHPEFGVELERFYAELESIKPNIIIALGNTPLWALTGMSGITKMRGTVQTSRWGKVLPTFHPSYILRDWAQRPIAVADLIKARRESEFPDVRRPQRFTLVDPTFSEVAEWIDIAVGYPALALDVETKGGQITEFGCSYSPSEAISIPFADYTKPGNSYWGPEEELGIRRLHIQRLLLCEAKKIFQNGLYDLQYILKEGYKIKNVAEDTMLQHHALYPEMKKSLGFLGSIYTNEASWKLLRYRKKDNAVKREDH